MTQEEMIQKIKNRIDYHADEKKHGYYLGRDVIDYLAKDILQDLQIAEPTARAERAEAERDAAIADMRPKDNCDICKYMREGVEDCVTYDWDCAVCKSTKCVCRVCRNESKWRWRGAREERVLPAHGGADDMSSAQMRDYVANKYPSKAWKDKVAKMTDAQIVAVYFRMIGR